MTNGLPGVATTVRVVGGPTLLIEVGGLRLLTDPAFDQLGQVECGPIGSIDVVLLSHDQHGENLGPDGRVLLADVALVLTTAGCARRLGDRAEALPAWYHLCLPRTDGGDLRITGTPAQPGPDSTAELSAPATGFVLSSKDIATIYISGNNVSLDAVRLVARRCGPIDVAVLFIGTTFTCDEAAEAARILDSASVIPAHLDGWAPHPETTGELRSAFARHGRADRLRMLGPGDTLTV